MSKGWGRGSDFSQFTESGKGLVSSDSMILDGRGRIKVSNQQLIFENKLPYGKADTIWGEAVNGLGAGSFHNPLGSCVDMAVSEPGDSVVRQTRISHQYQAGNILQAALTGCMSPELSCEKQIGIARSFISVPHGIDDGCVYEMIDGVIYATIYNSGFPTERAERNAWYDPFDGTGPSKKIIDFNKLQLFAISYLWQGVGNVYFYLFIDGYYYLAHTFSHVNQLDNVYMKSGTHPLIYRLYNTALGPKSMKHICTTVEIEGGTIQKGLAQSVDMGINPVTVTNSLTALIGIRLKALELDAVVDVLQSSIISLSNANVRSSFVWNPTAIAGTAPVWTPLSDSSIEVFYGDATNIITPGIQFDARYFSRDSQQSLSLLLSQFPLGSNVDGTPDVIYLCCQGVTVNASVLAGMSVRQLN